MVRKIVLAYLQRISRKGMLEWIHLQNSSHITLSASNFFLPNLPESSVVNPMKVSIKLLMHWSNPQIILDSESYPCPFLFKRTYGEPPSSSDSSCLAWWHCRNHSCDLSEMLFSMQMSSLCKLPIYLPLRLGFYAVTCSE